MTLKWGGRITGLRNVDLLIKNDDWISALIIECFNQFCTCLTLALLLARESSTERQCYSFEGGGVNLKCAL